MWKPWRLGGVWGGLRLKKQEQRALSRQGDCSERGSCIGWESLPLCVQDRDDEKVDGDLDCEFGCWFGF